MLDEKHPVRSDGQWTGNADRSMTFRIGIIWLRSNWRTMPRIRSSWHMLPVRNGSLDSSMAKSHPESSPGDYSNVPIISRWFENFSFGDELQTSFLLLRSSAVLFWYFRCGSGLTFHPSVKRRRHRRKSAIYKAQKISIWNRKPTSTVSSIHLCAVAFDVLRCRSKKTNRTCRCCECARRSTCPKESFAFSPSRCLRF